MKNILNKIKEFFTKTKTIVREINTDPIVIEYKNTTDEDVNAILFGWDDFCFSKNYGNPKGVIINTFQGGKYSRILSQTMQTGLKFNEWRFISKNQEQLRVTFDKYAQIGNNLFTRIPMNIGVMKDVFQYSQDVIVVKKQEIIRSNTYYSFPLLAKTTLVIVMYPDIVKKEMESVVFKVNDGQKKSINLKNKIADFFKKLLNNN
jgi:hypothetical protein